MYKSLSTKWAGVSSTINTATHKMTISYDGKEYEYDIHPTITKKDIRKQFGEESLSKVVVNTDKQFGIYPAKFARHKLFQLVGTDYSKLLKFAKQLLLTGNDIKFYILYEKEYIEFNIMSEVNSKNIFSKDIFYRNEEREWVKTSFFVKEDFLIRKLRRVCNNKMNGIVNSQLKEAWSLISEYEDNTPLFMPLNPYWDYKGTEYSVAHYLSYDKHQFTMYAKYCDMELITEEEPTSYIGIRPLPGLNYLGQKKAYDSACKKKRKNSLYRQEKFLQYMMAESINYCKEMKLYLGNSEDSDIYTADCASCENPVTSREKHCTFCGDLNPNYIPETLDRDTEQFNERIEELESMASEVDSYQLYKTYKFGK